MATTVIKHTYHLKGGDQEAVEQNNPLLDRREPIVVFMNDGSTKMKVGDGIHHYKELPWLGDGEVFSARTRRSFPNIGRVDVIYKEESTRLLYQWNPRTADYEELLSSGGSTDINFESISGGTAEDLIV